MILHLSAQTEKVVPYEYFGDDHIMDLMPLLINAGYYPAGVAVIIDRRQNAPEEVRANFNTFFWTGDSIGIDETDGALLTLDSLLLRQLTSESPLNVNGALKLESRQWQELKKDKEHSLYLTPQEVEAAHEKGYVLKDGKFVPANKTVAKVWDYLNRGRDLQTYAQLVGETSGNSKDIMRLYFDRSRPSAPILRSLVVDSVDEDFNAVWAEIVYAEGGTFSCINGYNAFYSTDGRLVGVAAELSEGKSRTEQGEVTRAHVAQNGGLVQRSELEVVLEEFKLKDPAKLRKALQLYNAAKNLKL